MSNFAFLCCEAAVPSHANKFLISPSIHRYTYPHKKVRRWSKHEDFMKRNKGFEINNAPVKQWLELCLPPLLSRSTPSSPTQLLLWFLK